MQQKMALRNSDLERNEPELSSLDHQSAEDHEFQVDKLQHDLLTPFNKFSQQMACS